MLSNFEKAYKAYLDDEIDKGNIITYTQQKAINLIVYNASQELLHFKDYKIDFVVDTRDAVEWVEVKGFQTNDWLNKWQLAQHLFYDFIDKSKNAKLVLVTGKAEKMHSKIVKSYYC
tara:strand:- start:4398 stop:4748 length:351 start_codon:yes stop_codon:yes gene_type:complete